MKLLLCAALLLACHANAGELLPVSGDEAEAVQERLDEYTRPVVESVDDQIKVETIVESIDLSGRAKRLFLGPFAGDSHIQLRIRIIDGPSVAEKLIEDEAGNWKGTFRPGEDYDMLERVALKVAEFVEDYRRIGRSLSSPTRLSHDRPLETTQHDSGDDGPPGMATAAPVPPTH